MISRRVCTLLSSSFPNILRWPDLGHISVPFVTQTRTARVVITRVFDHRPPADLGNKRSSSREKAIPSGSHQYHRPLLPLPLAHHLSSDSGITGLISMMGVPSKASNGQTLIQPGFWISNTSARCKPIGLGRSGERVANTPRRGSSGLPRG